MKINWNFKTPSSLIASRGGIIVLLLLSGLEWLAAVIFLLALPAEKGNALLAGYSAARLAMAGGQLLAALLFLILVWKFFRRPDLAEKLEQRLKERPSVYRFLLEGSAFLFVCACLVIFGLPATLPETMQRLGAYIPRLAPAVLCTALTLGQLFLWLLAGKKTILTDAETAESNKKPFLRFLPHLAAAVAAFLVYFLFLNLPLPVEIGLSLRYDFLWFVFPLWILFWLAFRQPGARGTLCSLGLTLILFSQPLTALWNRGVSDSFRLGGLLPQSDATSYLTNALRLLNGQQFIELAGRRPLFPALLAGLLNLTGQNLQMAQAVIVALAAFACCLAAWKIRSVWGAPAASLVMLLVFLYYRLFTGTVLTEHLGLTAGALAFALLLHGVSTPEKRASRGGKAAFLAGLFMLAFALNARAGAFFILPALVLWSGFYFRTRGEKTFSIRFILLAGGAVALAFLLNWAVLKISAKPESLPFSNFSYTLYGLTQGGVGWEHIFTDYPKYRSMQDPERSIQIYQLAISSIRNSPSLFLRGLIRSWADFFSPGANGPFGFIHGSDRILYDYIRLGWIIFSGLGLVFWVLRRKDAVYSFLLASLGGIFLSIPFAPLIDANYMRVYAASMFFLWMLPAVGIGVLFTGKADRELPVSSRGEVNNGAAQAALIVGLALALSALLVPTAARLFSKPAALPEISCLPDQQAAYFRISAGSYIKILPDKTLAESRFPRIRWSDFKHSLVFFKWHDELDTNTLAAGASLMQTIDLRSSDHLMVMIPSNLFPSRPATVAACGKFREGNSWLLTVEKVEIIP